jgi:hypothetical protein
MSRSIPTPPEAKLIAELNRVEELAKYSSVLIPVEVQGNGLMALDAQRLEQSFVRTIGISPSEYQFDLASLGIPVGNYAVVLSVEGDNPLDINLSASLEGMMMSVFAHHTLNGQRVAGIPQMMSSFGFGQPFGRPFDGKKTPINITCIFHKRR